MTSRPSSTIMSSEARASNPAHPDRIRRVLPRAPMIALLALLPGCITVQAIEPVLSPPPVYQIDVSVPVEFVSPPLVGFRCAERGAKFLGMPGLNSGACADQNLVTMPDPCLTFTSGWYGEVLCREITPARAARRAGEEALIEAGLSRSPGDLADSTAASVDAAPSLRPQDETPARAGLYRTSLSLAGTGTSRPGATARVPVPSPGPNLGTTRLQVEFIAPQRVAYRCAERGAKFNAGSDFGACRDETLVTMPNPCLTITAGWYARTLCHELAHANGWAANHAGGTLRTQKPILMARDSPQAIAHREAMEAKALPRSADPVERDVSLQATLSTPLPPPAPLLSGPGIHPPTSASAEETHLPGTTNLLADVSPAPPSTDLSPVQASHPGGAEGQVLAETTAEPAFTAPPLPEAVPFLILEADWSILLATTASAANATLPMLSREERLASAFRLVDGQDGTGADAALARPSPKRVIGPLDSLDSLASLARLTPSDIRSSPDDRAFLYSWLDRDQLRGSAPGPAFI
jgi:hypothetical protein